MPFRSKTGVCVACAGPSDGLLEFVQRYHHAAGAGMVRESAPMPAPLVEGFASRLEVERLQHHGTMVARKL